MVAQKIVASTTTKMVDLGISHKCMGWIGYDYLK
jgi:hypothetical protein